MSQIIIFYLLIGSIAGFFSGLLGIGGGIILVQAMLLTFSWQAFDPVVATHVAVGTSLAIIFFTAMSGTMSYHRRGKVDWSVVATLVPGLLIGTILGGITIGWLSGRTLGWIIGGCVLLMSIQIWGGWAIPHSLAKLGKVALATIAAGIGWISALLGIGGGLFTVPLLVMSRISVHRAVANSSACAMCVGGTGAITSIFVGWHTAELPQWSSGFVYWPAVLGMSLTSIFMAPVGARVALKTDTQILRRIFAILLVCLGVRLLLLSYLN